MSERESLISARFTPSQELVLEVLSARYRLGEGVWTFASKHGRAISQLADLGYVWSKHGIVDRTLLVGLTDRGKQAVLSETYVSLCNALRVTVRAVNDNALAWHAGEDGKARALKVIAVWTSEALAGRLHPSVEMLEADRA